MPDACVGMPIAVARFVRHQVCHLLHGFCGGQITIQPLTKQGKNFVGMKRLGTDAHDVHAGLPHVFQFINQIVDAGRLRLDAVQSEERLAFAGFQCQAVSVVEAAELAVILG